MNRPRAPSDAGAGIDYPVVIDNGYGVWSAFANQYWPALYFVDAAGVIHDHHFGEGRYEQSEHAIQWLLGVERELVSIEGVGVEAAADWDHLRTPETYLGYERSDQFASAGGGGLDERRVYELPERLHFNNWALGGEWTIGREMSRSTPLAGASPTGSTRATRISFCPPERESRSPFAVLLDGGPPGPSHGADVDEAGNGLLPDGRLYQLVREDDTVRERTLEITLLEPGAKAYVFTFG